MKSFRELIFETNQETLNPKIWNGRSMRKKFDAGVEEFVSKYLPEIGLKESDVFDIRIVGGNASYDWSPQSDADIQIILKPSVKMSDSEFRSQFKLVSLMNGKYEPEIDGIDTNMFLMKHDMIDKSPRHQSIYSIGKNKWIKEPGKIEEVNEALVNEKVNDFIQQIEYNCTHDEVGCHERLLKRLKNYRDRGLKTEDGEKSFANRVYRKLSRTGKIEAFKKHTDELKKRAFKL